MNRLRLALFLVTFLASEKTTADQVTPAEAQTSAALSGSFRHLVKMSEALKKDHAAAEAEFGADHENVQEIARQLHAVNRQIEADLSLMARLDATMRAGFQKRDELRFDLEELRQVHGNQHPSVRQREAELELLNQRMISHALEIESYYSADYSAEARPARGWWSSQTGGLVGGIAGGLVGILGALVGTLVSLGRARKVVLPLMFTMSVLGAVTAVVGIVAVAIRQPYEVYYPLLLAGLLSAVIFGALIPTARRRYDEIELRRISAADV